MDGNIVFLIHVLIFLNLEDEALACKNADQFQKDCLIPYNNLGEGDTFWENSCSSDAGLKVLTCIETQYEDGCPRETEEQVNLFNSFEELFQPYNMSINYACENQLNPACKEISSCFPERIYTFRGTDIFAFYDYFCGDQYLQHMFTCSDKLKTDCPVSVQRWSSSFTITTPSATLDYDALAGKTQKECGKFLTSDSECVKGNVTELGTCGRNPSIDIPRGFITCEHSDEFKRCVDETCGSTVANYYDEMFKFSKCGVTIDGDWSGWGEWASCSISCEEGIRIRNRACNNPPPTGDGKDCVGDEIEVGECNLGGCPVDGVFSIWGFWSECTQTCGRGSRVKKRACNSPAPANGGSNCTGEFNQTETCNEQKCPVDGVFSIWGSWSECTQTCGRGSRVKKRACNSPAPANGGSNCTGEVNQTEPCNEQECPVNGMYGAWNSWGPCTGAQSCGPGVQTRSRTCDSPPPSNGGKDCSGPSAEENLCYQEDCAVNGGFGEWGVWSSCTHSCGGGIRTKTRNCDNPTRANGGSDCSGPFSQTQTCNEQLCPVTSCPTVTDTYGTWQETQVGLKITLQCERAEEEGSYSRWCEVNGVWGDAIGHCEINGAIFNELNGELQELSNQTNSTSNVSGKVENIIKNMTSITNSIDATTSGETIEKVVDTAQHIVDFVETSKAVTEAGSQSFFELMSNIIDPEIENTWNAEETDIKGSDVLDMVDRYSRVMQEVNCDIIDNGKVDYYENPNLYFEIGKVQGDVKNPSQKDKDSYIEISAETLSKKGVTDVCYGGSSYSAVGDITEKYVSINGSTAPLNDGQQINSEVVSIQLRNLPGVTYDNLDPPVRVTLKLKNESLSKPVCVFWDYEITYSGRNGAWSSRGCKVANVTRENVICECSHLTNFAVLMSPLKISKKHSKILSIISAVGCAISMVCLILTLAVHALVWRLVRSDRAIILMNLCVALLLALGIFLSGVNRTESQQACAAIAAVIQILFLAVFFFMLLIGIEILICVVHVFVTKFRIKIFLPVAWLAPVAIVGISLGVTKAEGYGNDHFCWLDIGSGIVWSFIGPAAFVIFVNFIIILVVFKKMASSSVLKSKSTAMKVKTGVRSLCVLLPLMGLTWVFGLLSVNKSLVFFQYLFCICNSLQGLFIFLFHCVFNRQVRDAIKRRQDRRKSLQTFSSDLRKQSRSLSKDATFKTRTSDESSSSLKKKGTDNKACAGRKQRTKSDEYRPEDWDKLERKKYHKDIRRGSKLYD